MPTLAQTVMATTTAKVQLKPSVRKKLLAELKAYTDAAARLKEAKQEVDIHLGSIEEMRDEIGERKLEFEGFKVSRVGGDYTYYDDRTLLQWISTAQLAEAKKTRPKKEHTRVTVPGQKEQSYD